MMNGWRFTCGPRNFGRLFDLWMWRPTRTGTEVLSRMEMQQVPEEDAYTGAGSPIVLNLEEMQGLFDELHRAGFRPTHQPDEKSALAATERHLADLQKLLGLAEDASPIKIVRES